LKMASPPKPVLLLRLEGPLQSWGIRSRWDVRDSAKAPTKSGIVGLLGCALGYERGDERLLQISRQLRLGVRVEHAGRMVTDYQTITDYLPTAGGEWKGRDGRRKSASDLRESGALPATIISPRAYLEDASFLVALEESAPGSGVLEECARALVTPRWPLFLGRKCCIPTRPIYDARCDGLQDHYADIEDALRQHPWSFAGSKRQVERLVGDKRPLRVYIENKTGSALWQDVPQPGAARLYGFRPVHEDWFAWPPSPAQEEKE
jgi:CRISPR system Cascade subunit CasD